MDTFSTILGNCAINVHTMFQIPITDTESNECPHNSSYLFVSVELLYVNNDVEYHANTY